MADRIVREIERESPRDTVVVNDRDTRDPEPRSNAGLIIGIIIALILLFLVFGGGLFGGGGSTPSTNVPTQSTGQ